MSEEEYSEPEKVMEIELSQDNLQDLVWHTDNLGIVKDGKQVNLSLSESAKDLIKGDL